MNTEKRLLENANEPSCLGAVSVSVTDLRRGNLINHISFGVVKISAIATDGLNIEYENNFYWDDTKFYQPIPLTEEWLLKFGFTKPKDSEGYLLNGLVFYDGFLSSNQKEKLKSVHQLQNLYYALIGSELQIGNLTEH